MSNEFELLEMLNRRLNQIIANTSVGPEGQILEIRALIHRLGNVRIEIYPNEHPPPHFHVRSPEIDASFSIVECNYLEGNIDNKTKKHVEYFHQHHSELLIKAWNQLRPSNCPVGLINILN